MGMVMMVMIMVMMVMTIIRKLMTFYVLGKVH